MIAVQRSIPVLVAVPLAAGCTIVGGADYVDMRNDGIVYAEWNEDGTAYFTECPAPRTEMRPIPAPPRDALISTSTSGVAISERNYRRADFFVCPEEGEVSQ